MVRANSSWRPLTPVARASSMERRSWLDIPFRTTAACWAAAMAASHAPAPARATSPTTSPDQGERTLSLFLVSTQRPLMKQALKSILNLQETVRGGSVIAHALGGAMNGGPAYTCPQPAKFKATPPAPSHWRGINPAQKPDCPPVPGPV